jgi:betaine reductase
VDTLGSDSLVVLVGTPNVDSSRLYALTVTEGDPTWAGVLADAHLDLPVYHITEPEVKTQIDPEVYEPQVGLLEMVLETDEIAAALHEIRNGNS